VSAAAGGLEWHRGKQLKHAVLCALAERIYHNCGGQYPLTLTVTLHPKP
jgi:hypothetical protein